MRARTPIALACLTVCLVGAANAATYTYEGDPYFAVFNAYEDDRVVPYDDDMRMRILLEVPTPLTATLGFQFLGDVVTTYWFRDGAQTLDQSNSVLDTLTLRFDETGNIAEWQMIAQTTTPAAEIGQILRVMSSSGGAADFFGRDLSTNGRCQVVSDTGSCAESIVNSAFTTGTQNAWTRQPDTPTPVPLPPALWLLGGVMAGLLAWSRFGRAAPHSALTA